MNGQPPKWIDRFLQWYCNPDLLEEIQGDAYELYYERVEKSGKRSANLNYILDVLRFFRWSNIRRNNGYMPGSTGALWNLNFKMAVRHAGKNKLIFTVKTVGLSLCLAFALLLTAFIINEITFDQSHINRDRIYRVTSKITFQDHVTNYAISPLPIGQAIVDDIPEVENYFRFMYASKPFIRLDDKLLYDETVLVADSNFLNILTYDFVEGDRHGLDEPDQIVLTESLAKKLFGNSDALGQTLEFGDEYLVEVTAIIKDVPVNSHLQFNALLSWDTEAPEEDWSNINSFNYILLKPGANINTVEQKMPEMIETYHDLIAREYKATFEILFEKLTDIRFGEILNEDIAEKGSTNNIFVLITIIALFLITGLINYLNLTLAELTANLKKIGVIRVFGGLNNGHQKMLAIETAFTLFVVIPFTIGFTYTGWILAADYLAIHINVNVLLHPLFSGIIIGFLFLLFLSTRVNSYVLSKTSQIIQSLKGKFTSSQSGIPTRKLLVGAQLSFSIIMIALVIVVVDQFRFIQNADKGFDDTNTIVLKISGNKPQKPFIETIQQLSGVANTDASSFYLGGLMEKYVFQIESETGTKEILVPRMNCGYNYMDVLNMKMVKGRSFKTESDKHNAYIINEAAAKSFGWSDPIGKSIAVKFESGQLDRPGTVIGVVKDFAFASMHEKIEPLVIVMTNINWDSPYLYIKMNPLRPPSLITEIEKEYRAQWPEYPFVWEYLDTKYMSLYAKDYEVKNIFEAGLIISILISCLGIFSISALLVTLRTKEMGIRKVVGATSIQLFFHHTKSFLQFLIISILVSWPAIWYLSGKWLQNFAYHIELNIWYFIIPGVMVLLITLLTSGYHGIKTAMINPVDTLKYE